MKFVRDNDDPKLMSDLERLAGREPSPPVEEFASEADASADGDAADDASVEDRGPLGPLDDPFVQKFVRASIHLKRYGPFYAGAAVWAFVMLLIQPLGGGGESTNNNFAGASSNNAVPASNQTTPVSDLNADAIAAPTFEAITGSSASSFDTSTEPAFESPASQEFASPSTTTTTRPPTTTTTVSFGDDSTSEAEAPTIVRSGYASATGGTPLEQDPGSGGLPVAATGGNDNKRSYLQLSRAVDALRLRQSPNNAIQPDSAVVKLCPMDSADWKPTRGQAINGSPSFSSACATGSRADGIWTFELTSFTPEEVARGFTLTPGPGTGTTFQVVFEPVPLPPTGA